MPPKRLVNGKQQVDETSRPYKRSSRTLNHYNIVFDNPEQERRYSVHVKCKLTPTRYMCEQTLNDLGLKIEIDRMFHVLGMLEYVSQIANLLAHHT